MYLPDWIQKHKEPHTEIKRIKNGFYKYEVAFVYNKEKKRTEKKTIRLLGKITEKDGFVPSSKDTLRRMSEELPQVDIKTFGVYNLFSDLMKEEIASLKEAFGDEQAERLLSFAMMRWAYQTPIKRAPNYHSHDFCSEEWARKNMSDKDISLNLKGKILQGAGEGLQDITCEQFIFLMTWFNQMLTEPERINDFVSVLYKSPEGKEIPAEQFRKLPQEIKTALTWYYLGSMAFMTEKFPVTFSGTSGSSSGRSVFENQMRVIDSLAGNDLTKKQTVKNSLLYDALFTLEIAAENAEKMKK